MTSHEMLARSMDAEAERVVAAAAAGAPNNAADILTRGARALRAVDDIPPPADNTVRDMMAHEAVRAMRVDRERALAHKDIQDDDELIRLLNQGNALEMRVARLISLTARYAGELQHTLIHPDVRHAFKGQDIEAAQRNAIRAVAPTWHTLVDPGLSGNARIACQNIEDALPKLYGLTVEKILEYRDEKDDILLDYFCAAVAARWRANTVFAAGPYKTGNEQNAVSKALNDAVRLCRDFTITGDRLVYAKRARQPTTLEAVRSAHSGAFYPREGAYRSSLERDYSFYRSGGYFF